MELTPQPPKLTYDQEWMPPVADSLGSDFWQYGPVGCGLVRMVHGPVKFSESVSIFVNSGEVKINLSLRPYTFRAPATVFVRKGDILQVEEVSDDFEAHCMLFSPQIIERLFGLVADMGQVSSVVRCPVWLIPEDVCPRFIDFYDRMKTISGDADNPRRLDAILFYVASFHFQIAYKLTPLIQNEEVSVSSRTVEIFLRLVNRHFRSERQLEFYADKMKITSKHLSRTLRKETGMTAAQWIERYVILEAKVLLRSSTMNIQEIADYLSFATQSQFSKYFKKVTGKTPSEFRAP